MPRRATKAPHELRPNGGPFAGENDPSDTCEACQKPPIWLTRRMAVRHPSGRLSAETHIIPILGKRKLRQLTVEDVEKLLADKSTSLSTRSLRIIHSILNRAVRHAQVRDKVRRNVVLLCSVPAGREGRPSKSLTLDQAEAILKAS